MHHTTALSFLKKGYQVIPLSKRTGTPVIEFKDKPITEELIKSINWLHYDYALLMRGVWCIDVDTHAMEPQRVRGLKKIIELCGIGVLSILKTDMYDNGLDGYSSLIKHEYKDELVRNFCNTYQELTTSGGLHVLFKKREGVEYSQKIGVMKGVDVKANDNNYVKIYPSEGRSVLHSVKELPYYDGEFEQKVFAPKQQIITTFFGSSLLRQPKGTHEGKEAYERVINGQCIYRNDDLFKAACWAFENGYDIQPLYVLVGTVKNRDVFTQAEFDLTVESARRKVSYVSIRT